MKWAILTLISIFICVCCAQMLEWDPSGNLIAHSFSIWGDWSAHFTFITNLKERGLHWLASDNPLFFGMPFQYPFLSHVCTVILVFLTQLDVIHATFYMSMVLLFSLPFVLHRFFLSIGLTTRQSVLSVILFLFLGGLQAFDSSLNLNEPFTNQFKSGSVFTQIVLFEIFPQRAFLFGMILLLSGISFALGKLKAKQFSKTHFLVLSFYFAMLVWMHVHSWIAMGALLLVYALLKTSRRVFLFGISTLVLSLPLFYFLLFRSTAPSSLGWDKWYPGWAQNLKSDLPAAQQMNLIYFWIYNTGIFLPLGFFGAFLMWKRKIDLRSPLSILGITGLVLFMIAELFNIQPYFYDNLKIFTYAFLFLTPVAALAIDVFFQKKRWMPIGVLFLLGQTHTSTQDFIFFKDQKQTAPFFTKEEFDLAEQFRSIRHSPDSLVLIAPRHNHWIPALAGNPIFMGYPGWLWSWGIAYQKRETEVNEILSGSAHALEILSRYPIEYIVVNDQEVVAGSTVSIPFFKAHFTPILEHGAWHVFQTK